MFFTNLLETNMHVKNFASNIIYYPSTKSTTQDIWELYNNKKKLDILVITDNQTNGKGWFNNSWFSMPNKSITCSFLLNQIFDIDSFGLHALIVPIAIVKGIKKSLLLDVKLKWPNDIMYNNKKLGGILIESKERDRKYILNIGIGINVNEEEEDFPIELRGKAVSLKIIAGHPIQREPLLGSIFNELDKLINNININNIINIWMDGCVHKNKTIKFKYKAKTILGIFESINNKGQAVINTNKKSIIYDGPIQIL